VACDAIAVEGVAGDGIIAGSAGDGIIVGSTGDGIIVGSTGDGIIVAGTGTDTDAGAGDSRVTASPQLLAVAVLGSWRRRGDGAARDRRAGGTYDAPPRARACIHDREAPTPSAARANRARDDIGGEQAADRLTSIHPDHLGQGLSPTTAMKLTNTLLSAAIALVPVVAFADDAADHLEKATAHYNLQEWSKALEEYKQAYMIEPDPRTLWAIAQTQRLSGDCRSAILSYRAYMRGASAAGANIANEFITECEATLEAQHRAVEATLRQTQKPVLEPAPAREPPQLRSGLEPLPAATPRAPEHAPRSWMFDPLGDVLLVAGAGGITVGATLLTIGILDARDAPNQPSSGDYDRIASSARRDQWIGGVTAGLGLASTALAVWRFTIVKTSQVETPTSAFVLVPARDGALASYTARF